MTEEENRSAVRKNTADMLSAFMVGPTRKSGEQKPVSQTERLVRNYIAEVEAEQAQP